MGGEYPKQDQHELPTAGATADERAAALVTRGMTRYGRGDLEGAVADWERALEIRPEDARASEYLAFVRRHRTSLDDQFRSMRDTAEFRESDVPLGVEVPAPSADADSNGPYAEVELELGSHDDAAAGETEEDLSDSDSPPSEPYVQLTLDLGGDAELAEPSEEVEAAAGDGGAQPVGPFGAESVDDGWEIGESDAAARAHTWSDSGRKRRQDMRREETTVPGGNMPPPLPDGVSLSKDALAELRPLGDGESGEERTGPGIGGEVELGDLSRLETGSVRDDRVLAGELDAAEMESPLRDHRRGKEDLDEELTTELPRGKLAAAPVEPGDEELTLERRAFDAPGARRKRRAPTEDPMLPAPAVVDDSSLADTTVRRWPAGGDDRDIDGDATNEVWRVPVRTDLVLEAAAEASMTEIAAAVLAELDSEVPEEESEDERIRRRVTQIIQRAEAESDAGRHRVAIAALELALEERPDSPISQKVVHRHRDLFLQIYQRYFGDMSMVPVLAVPMNQLSARKLDHRTAFLVTRVDGSLSFEEILDVAGMTRLEACRHMARLLFEGVLMVR